jgi:hypothetical protein
VLADGAANTVQLLAEAEDMDVAGFEDRASQVGVGGTHRRRTVGEVVYDIDAACWKAVLERAGDVLIGEARRLGSQGIDKPSPDRGSQGIELLAAAIGDVDPPVTDPQPELAGSGAEDPGDHVDRQDVRLRRSVHRPILQYF